MESDTALIREIERWATRRGAGTLRLSVKPGNAPAIALYTRHDFRDAEEISALDQRGSRVMTKLLPALHNPR
ncbi:GNAT family N-acetyltransferase [Nonomuraea sp. NPDC001023]|uniref:GNAT family N-acetyltransferase n=1 Tax=unclassified Nonomuraea TaxID=2593643 RepID=UPI003325F416